MADRTRSKGGDEDRFGYAQQPKHRTDATTGDEGLDLPAGNVPEQDTDGADAATDSGAVNEQVPGYPTEPRGRDAQE